MKTDYRNVETMKLAEEVKTLLEGLENSRHESTKEILEALTKLELQFHGSVGDLISRLNRLERENAEWRAAFNRGALPPPRAVMG